MNKKHDSELTMFETDLGNLANLITETVMKDGTSLEDRLDAFAKLTTYYGLWLKRKSDDGDHSFTGSLQRVRAQNGGRSQVRAGGGAGDAN